MPRLTLANSLYRLLTEVWRGPDVVTFREGSSDRSKWRTDNDVRQYVVFGSHAVMERARAEKYLERVLDDAPALNYCDAYRLRLTEAGKAFVDAKDMEWHGEPLTRVMKASGHLVQWGLKTKRPPDRAAS